MSNVIPLRKAALPAEPSAVPTLAPAIPDAASLPNPQSAAGLGTAGKIGRAALQAVWVLTLLCWPVLRWVLSFDVLWQLIRSIYYWDTPGVYAGWTFLLHFAVLCTLTFWIGSGKTVK